MDQLKETLFKAYYLEQEKCHQLFETTPRDQCPPELHRACAASSALHNVIKQAGMVEDYTTWLVNH